jgi:Spy/CpxP family protein refolding chaperone
VLDELKIERAQGEVDDRRARAEFADAVAGSAFDAAKAAAAGERRVQTAAKLRDALTRALSAIHAVLRPEQRERFAYLVRTGVLAF